MISRTGWSDAQRILTFFTDIARSCICGRKNEFCNQWRSIYGSNHIQSLIGTCQSHQLVWSPDGNAFYRYFSNLTRPFLYFQTLIGDVSNGSHVASWAPEFILIAPYTYLKPLAPIRNCYVPFLFHDFDLSNTIVQKREIDDSGSFFCEHFSVHIRQYDLWTEAAILCGRPQRGFSFYIADC